MRDWIALYTSVLDSDTWHDLGSAEARVAWIVALLLGAQQTPEGTFDSESKLSRLLAKEGIAPDLSALLEADALEIRDGVVFVRGGR